MSLAPPEIVLLAGVAFAAAAAVAVLWHRTVRLGELERAERLRAERYLDIAGAMILALDRDGRVTVANRRTREVIGRPDEDLVGVPWFDLAIPERLRKEYHAGWARMMAGEIPPVEAYEAPLLTASGEERIVSWRIRLLHDDDGRITGTLSSGDDVTDRRAVEEELRRDRRDLAAIAEVTRRVATADDARGDVLEAIRSLSGAAYAMTAEPDGRGNLVLTAAAGVELPAQRHIVVGGEPSGSAVAYLSGEPFFVADVPGHPAVSQRIAEHTGAVSALWQPARIGDRVLGVIGVGWSTRVESPDSWQATLIGLLADEVAIAIERAAHLRMLEAAAVTDSLTGIMNRRAWDDALATETARAGRSERPLSVVVLDLDRFKAVNDQEGHQAGDRLLKACAAAWRAELRPTDVLARIGGDEFAVLLADCDLEGAQVLCHRLGVVVPHAGGCSAGVAQWNGEESVVDLMRRADDALYADKAARRSARLDDPGRLAAAAGLTGAVGSQALDALSRVAAHALDVPMAAVSVVESERHLFAGQHGLPEPVATTRELPIESSLCRHPTVTGRPLVVDDASAHPLAEHPAVREDLDLAAYAGVPLQLPSGDVVGALCAMDAEPRLWTPDDVRALANLATLVVAELERLGAGA